MPVSTTNQRGEIATVAAQHGWTARDYSLPKDTTAGAIVKVVYIRGQLENVTAYYNTIDKLVSAVGTREPNKPGEVMHRLQTLREFMSVPALSKPEDELEIRTAKHAVTALREGKIVATADTNVLEGPNRRWFVRNSTGTVVAMIGADTMSEPDMRRAVLAVIKAIA